MTKTKKNLHDDSQIEEIDLSMVDLSAIDFDDLTSLESTKQLPLKKEKEQKPKEFVQNRNKSDEDEDNFEDPIITRDFEDDFEDNDDEDNDDDDETEGESKKKDSYKTPKDFFTDKRRQKTLKKFIDVTVPQEFLDGLSEDLQLLIKK